MNANENLPFVSIIIPALNSEKTIGLCLDSLKSLDYPSGNFEIIVVDNGSIDKTSKIALQYGTKIIYRPDIKIGAVRNSGAKIAHGSILAFTDSDCIVPVQWINNAVDILRNPKIGAVGGGCLVPADSVWLEKAWVSEQIESLKYTSYLPASNFILTKAVFNEIGGFNEKIYAGEDDNLSLRITERGYFLVSSKACYIVHLGYPKRLIDITKRQIWHGKNILENKASFFDKMFILSHIYLLTIVFLLVSLFILPYNMLPFIVFLLLFILTPMLSAAYKTYGSGKNFDGLSNLKRFIYLIPIFNYFLFGRAIGLLINYKNILFGRKICGN
jgi:glycosyltransferase involved in cell wall biosynthesis